MERLASIHIKPCNVGQSEAHNLRTEAYMKHIKRENVYIRNEMTEKNESWVAPEVNNQTLQDYLDGLAHLVKEKTGRAMQTKVRERVNQKTGRVVKVTGCSALKEGVINCDDNTTMEDLQHFCRLCKERWGITAIQIFLHRDEGHYDEEGEWKPNLHAHIVFDWINHETGKTYKLDKFDMEET